MGSEACRRARDDERRPDRASRNDARSTKKASAVPRPSTVRYFSYEQCFGDVALSERFATRVPTGAPDRPRRAPSDRRSPPRALHARTANDDDVRARLVLRRRRPRPGRVRRGAADARRARRDRVVALVLRVLRVRAAPREMPLSFRGPSSSSSSSSVRRGSLQVRADAIDDAVEIATKGPNTGPKGPVASDVVPRAPALDVLRRRRWRRRVQPRDDVVRHHRPERRPAAAVVRVLLLLQLPSGGERVVAAAHLRVHHLPHRVRAEVRAAGPARVRHVQGASRRSSSFARSQITSFYPSRPVRRPLTFSLLRPPQDALALRESQTTAILTQVRNDVTRYRYGDEQHLEEALGFIFRCERIPNIPFRSIPFHS